MLADDRQTPGNPGCRLRGKARLPENFAIGIAAEGRRFELMDVLTSVGSMCVIYRRETVQLVTDLLELNDKAKGVRVLMCYGSAR